MKWFDIEREGNIVHSRLGYETQEKLIIENYLEGLRDTEPFTLKIRYDNGEWREYNIVIKTFTYLDIKEA